MEPKPAMMSLEVAAIPFARSLLAKRELLDVDGLSTRQRARVMESLSDDLKKFCDVVTPELRAPFVSRAARAAAATLDVDLCQHGWHSQSGFDKGRAVFHVEHVIPVRALRATCLTAASLSDVVNALSTVRIAWILKSEDRELTRLGYRTQRDDPERAYREAGIELVTCHQIP
jgi:hypothetical protein